MFGWCGGGQWGRRLARERLTGYRGTSLIKNQPHTLGPPYNPRYNPTVGSWWEGVSYERGTPVVRERKVVAVVTASEEDRLAVTGVPRS